VMDKHLPVHAWHSNKPKTAGFVEPLDHPANLFILH
jgi:hypothetical protein